MLRYIAFIWDCSDLQRSQTAERLLRRCHAAFPHWATVLQRTGFRVLCESGDPAAEVRVLHDDAGVVIGRLFAATDSHGAEARVACLQEGDSRRVIASCGRELVGSYWGNYVAFLVGETRGDVWVLRGPASPLPCLHTGIDGVDIYFSWMEACANVAGNRFTVNWAYVARSLLGPVSGVQTGWNEVREIPQGTAEHLRSDSGSQPADYRTQHVYWSPAQFVDAEPAIDVSAAPAELFRTTCHCVRAWGLGRRHILHALSGGLDSSIVLSCLRTGTEPVQTTCVTHFTPSPESDERPFAHLAARHVGCSLIEHERNSMVDLRKAFSPVRFESSQGLRAPEVDRIDVEIAGRIGADAIFRGNGGDELFCRHHSMLYVSDFLRSQGVRSPLLELLLDCAVSEGESVWGVLRSAAYYAFFPERWNAASTYLKDQEDRSFLDRDVLRAVIHDDIGGPQPSPAEKSIPAGKQWLATLISARRAYYSPFSESEDADVVSPLLSQPLIELCLRMPTWYQMMGRRDRSVARQAFHEYLPPEILQRRSKGGAENLGWQIFTRNLPFIRELLLDGRVVRAGIIDRKKLEAALAISWEAPRVTVPIFALVGAEMWLAAWEMPNPSP